MNNWLSGFAYFNSLHICGNVIATELLKCTLNMLTGHYRHPLLLVEKFGIVVLGLSKSHMKPGLMRPRISGLTHPRDMMPSTLRILKKRTTIYSIRGLGNTSPVISSLSTVGHSSTKKAPFTISYMMRKTVKNTNIQPTKNQFTMQNMVAQPYWNMFMPFLAKSIEWKWNVC